jgi:hypothetical protein
LTGLNLYFIGYTDHQLEKLRETNPHKIKSIKKQRKQLHEIYNNKRNIKGSRRFFSLSSDHNQWQRIYRAKQAATYFSSLSTFLYYQRASRDSLVQPQMYEL